MKKFCVIVVVIQVLLAFALLFIPVSTEQRYHYALFVSYHNNECRNHHIIVNDYGRLVRIDDFSALRSNLYVETVEYFNVYGFSLGFNRYLTSGNFYPNDAPRQVEKNECFIEHRVNK